MRSINKYFMMFLLILFFTGCSTRQEDQPTDDLLATEVASILTETAMNETLPPTETMVPTITATQIEPSTTPTESPTPESTPTVTEEPSDPAILLGAPAWIYDFESASSPWDYESEQALFTTSDGYLNITARSNPNWHSWWVSSPTLKNAYVEMKMEMDACSGFDRFGFAVRGSSDGEQFYFLDLTCDRRWGFFRMAPGVEINEIKPYQEIDALKGSWSESHRVGIWMEGEKFRFFIDGEEFGVASDDELINPGYLGFMIAFAETPGYTVRVDQLQYWNIP